jgi:hypothetical protein
MFLANMQMLAIKGMKKLNGLLSEENNEDTSALYDRVLNRSISKLQAPITENELLLGRNLQ